MCIRDSESKEAQLAETPEVESLLKSILTLEEELKQAAPEVTLSLEIDLTEEIVEEIGEEAAETFVAEVKERIEEFLAKDPKEAENETDLHECQFHETEVTNLQALRSEAYSETRLNQAEAKKTEDKEAARRRQEAKVLQHLGQEDIRLLYNRLKGIDANGSSKRSPRKTKKIAQAVDTQIAA